MKKQKHFKKSIRHILSWGMLLCLSLMNLTQVHGFMDNNMNNSKGTTAVVDKANALVPRITISTAVPDVFFDVNTTVPGEFSREVALEFSNRGNEPLEYTIPRKRGDVVSLEVRTPSEARGVLQPQESVVVNVTVTLGPNAIDDRYLLALDINSNDPNTPVLQIPITVITSNKRGRFELPRIATFGTIDAADSRTRTFEFRNNGLADIIVEDVLPNTDALEILEWRTTTEDSTVAVGDVLFVDMRFQPGVVGSFGNMLRILSTAILPNRDAVYDIRGTGFIQLEFTNDDFLATINPFVSENSTLTVVRTLRNAGGTTLDFEIVLPDTNTILSIDTASGSLLPGNTVDIAITYDASGLEEVGLFDTPFAVNYSSSTFVSSFSNSFTVDAVLEVTDQQGSLPEGLVIELETFGSGGLEGFEEIINNSGSAIEIKSITTDLEGVQYELLVAVGSELQELANGSFVLPQEETLFIEFFEIPGNTTPIVGNLIIESNATNSLLKIPFSVEDRVLSVDPIRENVIANERILTVAPNPVIDSAVFTLKGIKNTQISSKLTNMLGQDIDVTKRITLNANGQGTINMSDLQQGYYFLVITQLESGLVYKTRLIKN